MAFDRQRRVASPTGASLNLYTRKPDGPLRAVVQINHGLSEHAARYARFADFLAGHGVASYAHDHRGHGHTTAPDAPLGRFGAPCGGDRVIADVAAIHDLIRAEHPGAPIVLFGHSMGGQIAANVLIEHPGSVQAAAFWNANLAGGFAARAALAVLAWERFRLGSDVPSRILPRLTFQAWGRAVPDRQTPFDWLSRDPAEVRTYIDDPLCGFDATISLWQDLFRFMLATGDDARLAKVPKTLPLNLVGGARDPATSGGGAVRHFAHRLRLLGFSNVTSTIYPDTRHESLHETNRDAVMRDFAAWLGEILRA